jgi:hypothetical protein
LHNEELDDFHSSLNIIGINKSSHRRSAGQEHGEEKERNVLLLLLSILGRLCGLVVRVPGYRSRGPGSIAGATRFSEK